MVVCYYYKDIINLYRVYYNYKVCNYNRFKEILIFKILRFLKKLRFCSF